MTLKLNRQILSAILLLAAFAPAVRADLITDPKEFNVLKNLTGGKKKDRSISPRPKYESIKDDNPSTKSTDKAGTDSKSSVKTDAKTDSKPSKSDSSKTDSKSDAKTGDKSSDKPVAKTK